MKLYFLLCLVFLIGCSEIEIPSEIQELLEEPQVEIKPIERDANTLLIANWNLQIFGQSKSNNEALMNYYVGNIDDYDIIFIQEIRDKEGTAFERLCSRLPEYDCLVSSRAGRSTSKEQYGALYNNKVNLIEFVDYNEFMEGIFERPPIKVVFGTDNKTYTFYNIHTKPDDVPNEMMLLDDIVPEAGNLIILGDLNADCDYYNNNLEDDFESFKWLIEDSDDTTVSQTDCAYDRIIITDSVFEDYVNHGIMKNVVKEQSDHYLVWLQLSI